MMSASAAAARSGPWSGPSPGSGPGPSCPCCLTREQLDKFGLVGEHGVCTAYRKGSSKTELCGELFVDHPVAGMNAFLSHNFPSYRLPSTTTRRWDFWCAISGALLSFILNIAIGDGLVVGRAYSYSPFSNEIQSLPIVGATAAAGKVDGSVPGNAVSCCCGIADASMQLRMVHFRLPTWRNVWRRLK